MFDKEYDSDEESSGSDRNAPTSKPVGLIAQKNENDLLENYKGKLTHE